MGKKSVSRWPTKILHINSFAISSNCRFILHVEGRTRDIVDIDCQNWACKSFKFITRIYFNDEISKLPSNMLP